MFPGLQVEGEVNCKEVLTGLRQPLTLPSPESNSEFTRENRPKRHSQEERK